MGRRNLNLIALAALFLITAFYETWTSVDRMRANFEPERVARPPLSLEFASAQIGRVAPEAAAAGVQRGDVLLAVNGRAMNSRGPWNDAISAARPGDSISITFRRGQTGQTITAAVRLAPLPPRGSELVDRLIALLTFDVAPALSLLLGFWVAAARLRDPLAWILLFLMMGFAQYLTDIPYMSWHGGFRDLGLAFGTAVRASWPVWMLLFGLRFPQRFAFERRLSWLKWIVIVPLALAGVEQVFVTVGVEHSFALVQPVVGWFRPYQRAMNVLYFATLATFFVSLAAKWGIATAPDARRRLRALVWGATVSLTPMLLLAAARRIGGWNMRRLIPLSVTIPALLLLLLFPVTMAYVIVVQRAMDVRVAIRQGLQYTLVRRGAWFLRVVIAGAIIVATASLLDQTGWGRFGGAMIIAGGVALILTLQKLNERLARWIDRRFFREAYQADRILNELSENVRTIVETGPLLETVVRRIAESLHVARAAVLLRTGRLYRPAYAYGYGNVPEIYFSENEATVRELRRLHQPVRVYFDDSDSWIYRHPGLNEAERAKLEKLSTQLLLPLAVKEKLLGFISLGPKQSAEPYSPTDLRLLQSVGTQAGLALENSQLTAAMAAEVAQRERLHRELEIAREVQERLFPQTLPPVPGLDYFGMCRPARGVGGDYYDFLSLPRGQLGIAIGDISGKGIAAALLMASLQASLRSQAVQAAGNLATLMCSINRLVYDASATNRYATFFYARYDPESRSLAYVNAGHNPPILLHSAAGGREVERLETGGLVVGALEQARYEQAVVSLQAGDLLVMFTDGVSEAMKTDHEEWGEERLIELLQDCDGLPAGEVARRIVGAADAFVAGTPQYDDMTLVVVRGVPA